MVFFPVFKTFSPSLTVVPSGPIQRYRLTGELNPVLLFVIVVVFNVPVFQRVKIGRRWQCFLVLMTVFSFIKPRCPTPWGIVPQRRWRVFGMLVFTLFILVLIPIILNLVTLILLTIKFVIQGNVLGQFPTLRASNQLYQIFRTEKDTRSKPRGQ